MMNKADKEPSGRPVEKLPVWAKLLIAISMVAIIVYSRLYLADMANWKPIASIALFSGFMFGRKHIPVLAIVGGMFVSDLFLGSYSWQVAIAVYGCLSAPILFGGWLGRIQSKSSLRFFVSWVASVVAGSLLFFLVTNLAFWRFTGLYSQDFAGITECLLNALPFLRNTLTSDMFFSGMFFGTCSIVQSVVARTSSQLVEIGKVEA